MGNLGRRLGPADCVVGARVQLLGTNYKILTADAATHSFMEAYPAVFPNSHSDSLMTRLKMQMATVSEGELRAAARGLDPAGSGLVPPQLFQEFLSFFNFEMSAQEQQALARRFSLGEGEGAPIRLR
jgi:hypothetical protein